MNFSPSSRYFLLGPNILLSTFFSDLQFFRVRDKNTNKMKLRAGGRINSRNAIIIAMFLALF
jgi:hypothetical protein